jgi:type I restriction enzyme, S subunit
VTDLPAGWSTALLSDVVANHDGKRVPVRAADRKERSGKYPYYGASGVIDFVDDYLFDGSYLLIAEDGANLLSRSTPIAFKASGRFWVNNHAHVVEPSEGVSLQYVEHWLNATDLRPYVTGTAQPKLTQKNLNALSIAVPPTNEQRRIVDKIEALNAKSRRAKEALEAIPPLLEKFRQSILGAAFRGDLTANWCAKNPDVEPASRLLERIRTERRRRWEEAELEKLRAKGTPPKDDRWKAKYQEPAPVDTEGLPELPEGWVWASVAEICPADAPAVYGIILPGDHVQDGVPYIRPADIEHGAVVIGELKRTTREIASNYRRSSLRAGDIVLSIVGTIGKVLVVTAELEGANITQSSARIRPPAGIATEYLRRALQSPLLTQQYDKYRFGNAVQRLNVEHVRSLAVPLAPTIEQDAVVKALEQTETTRIGETLVRMKAQLAWLDSAILAKAFRGELVPQDANDEPASVLLERIRAERNGHVPASGQRSRRKRAPKRQAAE